MFAFLRFYLPWSFAIQSNPNLVWYYLQRDSMISMQRDSERGQVAWFPYSLEIVIFHTTLLAFSRTDSTGHIKSKERGISTNGRQIVHALSS